MKTKIKEAISQYKMISDGDEIIVALSGGADSVALLYSMTELKNEFGITISACHINHGLRGEESDYDCQFVKKLCDKLEIKLYILETNIKKFQKKHESLEECARRIRYDFFSQVSVGKKIATAHTASDNAETVILNLVRGTALKGLCGIPPIRGNIIRPLIFCSREDIEKYCYENELVYVTDKTNFSLDYTRNKIRHKIIPILKEINPSIYDGFRRMNISLFNDNKYFENIAKDIKDSAKLEKGYDISLFQNVDEVVLNRIIYSVLSDNSIEPSSLRINSIKLLIKNGKGKINIEKNKFAIVKKGEFYIEYSEQCYRKR